jgi:hypothetical protein
MSNTLPPGYVVPNTSLPKTTGVLNIAFASLLLIFIFIQIGMTLLSPMLMGYAQQAIDEAQAKVAASRQQQIDALRKQEGTAETEEAKEAIRKQIQAMEAQAAQKVGPDMNVLAEQMKNPVIWIYSWTDEISALVLNVLMLVSGVGLLKLRERARRLALWVGGLKIARLVILALVQVFIVLPVTMKMQQDMMARMTAGAGAQAQAMQTAMKFGVAASTAMVFIGALFGMVWPILMIVMLTRPGSRAACLMASKPRRAPELLS